MYRKGGTAVFVVVWSFFIPSLVRAQFSFFPAILQTAFDRIDALDDAEEELRAIAQKRVQLHTSLTALRERASHASLPELKEQVLPSVKEEERIFLVLLRDFEATQGRYLTELEHVSLALQATFRSSAVSMDFKEDLRVVEGRLQKPVGAKRSLADFRRSMQRQAHIISSAQTVFFTAKVEVAERLLLRANAETDIASLRTSMDWVLRDMVATTDMLRMFFGELCVSE